MAANRKSTARKKNTKSASPSLERVQVGMTTLALLPGETKSRVEEIAAQVRTKWQPENIVEEFDCDGIVLALFKLERYKRFYDFFLANGLKREDLDRTIRHYHAQATEGERGLAIARGALANKRPGRSAFATGAAAERAAELPRAKAANGNAAASGNLPSAGFAETERPEPAATELLELLPVSTRVQ